MNIQTKEYVYWLAYSVCHYINVTLNTQRFQEYEVAMYTSDLAISILNGDVEDIKSFRETLVEEYEETHDSEAKELIDEIDDLLEGEE